MKTLIIDSSYLCYRAVYSMGSLSSKEMPTGVIFSFLNTILSLAKLFKSKDFIFTFDSRRSLRKRIYSEYKSNRTEQPYEIQELIKAMHPQREALQKEILPALGFKNIFSQSGLEADDIISVIVKDYDEDFVVISEDSDLYQLLDYCSMYSLKTKVLLTKTWFKATHGLEPDKWIWIKAIGGCSSDNVKGIEGFAELTSRKYLLGLMKPTEKKCERIQTDESKAIIKRNLELVTLPFPGTNPVELQENEFNFDEFINICVKYSFRSFLDTKKLSEWRDLLSNGE